MNSVYRKHLESYQHLMRKVQSCFKSDTNLAMVIHQIFCTMLFFASRVMDGDLENNEETTMWTFEQVYCFIEPHVRPELLKNEETLEHI